MKIAIQSTKELPFDIVSRVNGIITVEIDLYQKTKQGWYLRLVDTCDYEEEELHEQPNPENPEEMLKVSVKVSKSQSKIREKEYPSEFLNQLAMGANAKANLDNETFAHDLDKLFQTGLLLLTQQECLAGKGIYMSEAQDWKIVD